MRRLLTTLALLLTVAAVPLQAQVSPKYEGYYDVNFNGNNTTYSQALTHRYVGAELRFLSIALGGTLMEYRLPAAFGQKVSSKTAEWNLNSADALNNFNGIWFEQAKNRLWITSAEDYTNVNHNAKVTLVQLNANGSVTRLKQFYLNVPAKRVYGGCNKVPTSLVSKFGGPYVCGWGGYTSLVAQGGGASIGPTMYAIPDPDTISNGATVNVRAILDTAGSRGWRETIPQNYFDGGDPRQNPSSRPTSAPLSTAQWLSPNTSGKGWMTWGDSYYNTGAWVGDTFIAIASLCKGACWYQRSTLAFDGRTFEFHQWQGAALGSNILQRPSMLELDLPRGNTEVWGGNSPVGNIAGATYDERTGKLYLVGFPFGNNPYDGRVYQFSVGAGQPTPQPTPCVVGEWSPWSEWSAWATVGPTQQRRDRQRVRQILAQPAHGGTACPPAADLVQTETEFRTVEPQPDPDPDPVPDLDAKIAAEVARVLATWPKPQNGAPGPAGPKGDTGERGEKGEKGDPGTGVSLDQVRALIDQLLASLRIVRE